MLEQVAIALSITALLAYVNHRFIGLPPTIGIMSIALLLEDVKFREVANRK